MQHYLADLWAFLWEFYFASFAYPITLNFV